MHLYSEVEDVHAFNPSTDIPSLDGKVIIVTGGNAGIGKQTVLELSRQKPHKLYMTARSQAKYDAAMKDILAANPDAKVDFLELDLADLDSIKRAVKTFLANESRLDILINNAGILGKDHTPSPPSPTPQPEHPPTDPPPSPSPGSPPSLTLPPLSHEIHLGTNYIGPAIFTHLLLPTLQHTSTLLPASTPPRILSISSAAAYSGLVTSQPTFTSRTYTSTPRTDINAYQRYAISKLAQILWTRELARRYPAIVSVAVHPGRIPGTRLTDWYMSDRWNYYGVMAWVQTVIDGVTETLDVERGSWTGLWAAVAPVEGGEDGKDGERVVSGGLYKPIGKRVAGDKRCGDDKLAGELWEWTVGEMRRVGVEV